jgi:hypothetical protein|tara:strand:- start:2962 stop:3192 length:231 start_codon:yes stop_codon:yes gene_type:complete
MRASGARPYVAGGIIIWALALQAHVWSIPNDDLRRLRGETHARVSLFGANVDAPRSNTSATDAGGASRGGATGDDA